jgi:hypothetical protein
MKHKPFNELKRLGFPAQAEDEARRGLPGETGMLVVDEVLPGQSGIGMLQVGAVAILQPCYHIRQ